MSVIIALAVKDALALATVANTAVRG